MGNKGIPMYYGWIIVGVSFINLAVAFGIWYSFSVFFVAILLEFGWTRAATAGVFSAFILVYSVFPMVIGPLLDRLGPRIIFPFGSMVIVIGLLASSRMQSLWQYYLFYGLLAGMGLSSIGHIAHSIILPKWFLRKRGLAVGIAMAGVGIGIVTLVPLSQLMITRFGWRTAYLFLATIILTVVIPLNTIFQRKGPGKAEESLYGDKFLLDTGVPGEQRRGPRKGDDSHVQEWTLGMILGTFHFKFLFLTYIFAPFFTQGILLHQVAHLVEKGLSPEKAAFFFGLLGIVGSMGKIIFGLLSDKAGCKRSFIIAIGCNFTGILCLAFFREEYSVLLYGFAILFGLGYGAIPPVLAIWTAELFDGSQLGKIFGLLSLALGLGGAMSTWVMGKMFDVTASYQIAFMTALMACPLVVMFFCLSSRGSLTK